MNYSTNKVQVSYMMIWEHVHAHHSSCTVHTTVWLLVLLSCHIQISWLFPDLGPFPWP